MEDSLLHQVTEDVHESTQYEGDENESQGTPNEIIKRTCMKVALLGFGPSVAPSLSPGFPGLVMKLQMEMIEDIAKFYDKEVGSMKEVLWVLSGTNQGASTMAMQAAETVSTQAMSQISNRVAHTATANALFSSVPVVGPLTMASVNASTTYIIGRRADVYFAKGPELLQSYGDSVRAISGFDERKIARYVNGSWNIAKKKMNNASKGTARRMTSALGSARSIISKRVSFRRRDSSGCPPF